MECLQCVIKGFAQNPEMAGTLVVITTISDTVGVISHIVSTQPRDHLAGLTDAYQERRDPDPDGKGEKCCSAGLGGGAGGGTWAASGPSPRAGQPSQVVVSVNLKLPPHPREGKTVTLI